MSTQTQKPTMAPPWYEYQRKVKALFNPDPEIKVGDLRPNGGDNKFIFTITTTNKDKYGALQKIMPDVKTLGAITINVSIELDEKPAETNPYAIAFKGNPLVGRIEKATDYAGTEFTFICFNPAVLQFPNDDITDLYGNFSGLAQDVAREILSDVEHLGTNICTKQI